MHSASLICFFISAVSAVRHYGLQPSGDIDSLMDQHFQGLQNNDDLRLVSRFMTDEHFSHDGSDFLANELGIYNKTVADIFRTPSPGFSPIEARGLEVRSPVTAECTGHGDIEDHLSEDQVKQVCNAMATGVATGVFQLIAVIESKICVEAGTGHPLESCKTIMGMTKFALPTFSVVEIKDYCPQFLSFFVKCNGAQATANSQDNNGIEMAAFNSQTEYNCDNVNEQGVEGTKCVEDTVG